MRWSPSCCRTSGRGRTNAARSPGRLRQLAPVVGSNALVFVGQYTLYTYVSVLLLRSGASSAAVGPILLAFGVFGLIGVWSASVCDSTAICASAPC